jgi:hypothetical protein
MRSSTARRRDVSFYVNAAIAFAWVRAVTYFIVVVEYCAGQAELTQAQLLLSNAKTHVALSPASTTSEAKTTKENQGEKNGN